MDLFLLSFKGTVQISLRWDYRGMWAIFPAQQRSDEALRTFIIEREHVELESAGLLADVMVNALCSRLVDGDGVLQGLHAGLQAERQLGVTDWVSGGHEKQPE